MQRLHLWLFAIALVTFAGCSENKPKPETAAADDSGKVPANVTPEPDPYARAAPAGAGMGSDVASAPANDETIQPISATGEGHSKRSHVVKKGDTLYSISREYYGNNDGWKKIYEANKSKIPNKDSLNVGMKLVIP